MGVTLVVAVGLAAAWSVWLTGPGQVSAGVEHLAPGDASLPQPGTAGGVGSVVTTDPAWPDASTTGVMVGTRLEESGDLQVTTDGAVVEELLIRGTLTIRADDVRVSNVRVVGGWIDVGSGNTGIVISDTEVDGGGSALLNGVGYRGYTCIRCNVHGVGRGFNGSGAVEVRDSWVHDIAVEGDPATTGSHNEAFLSNGGANIRLIGNRFDAGSAPNVSASVALYGDFAPIENVLLLGNRLSGGGYCLYAGTLEAKPFPRAVAVVVMDNEFSRDEAPGCGIYGPVTGFDARTGIWEGNVWSDGSPVPSP